MRLARSDPELWMLVSRERRRQQTTLSLVASESLALPAALRLQGTHLSQKLAEGYSGERWATGCEYADAIEALAIARACSLFDAEHANIQAYSGSIANLAALLAITPPGETIMAIHPSVGGHHTHGDSTHLTGILFKTFHFAMNPTTGLLDYDGIKHQAETIRPHTIIVGSSSYPRAIDFARLADAAQSVGAHFIADIAHLAGLIAAKLHPSPVELADIVTSSTHKTLTGPRGGGLILSKRRHASIIDRAVFPFLQGAPVLDVIAARATLFRAAATPPFRTLMRNVVENARSLGLALQGRGVSLVTGGTDTHLLVADLREQKVDGRTAESLLAEVGITCGKVSLPGETGIVHGLRLGTVVVTQRGMGRAEMVILANIIAEVLSTRQATRDLRHRVRELAQGFPAQ